MEFSSGNSNKSAFLNKCEMTDDLGKKNGKKDECGKNTAMQWHNGV